MSKQSSEHNEKRLQEARKYWDDAAAAFDDKPDHGLHDPLIRETWTELLRSCLPQPNSTILDIGCGTGTISVVVAGLGHTVTGIDLSPSMIALAQAKAAANGVTVEFHVMDAAFPQFPNRRFDVIICRHLLWALSEPEQVLQRWSGFLNQPGRLVLIDGLWGTSSGLHAKEITRMLPSSFTNVSVINLSEEPNYWGGPVNDERYAIIADNMEVQPIQQTIP